MKNFLVISLTLISLNALAFTTEFRCDFYDLSGKSVRVEVSKDFPGSVFSTIELITNQNSYRYSARPRMVSGFYKLELWAGSTRLEMDLFPDRTPQWGRWYQSKFTSPDLDNGHEFRNIECQYIR